MKKPRVVIADDHRLFLEAFEGLIETQCEIVGAATDGRQVVQLATELRPDLVCLDITMPLLNGIEAMRRIKRVSPETKLITVTMQSSRDYVREAFEAGASAYVLKQGAAAELLSAIDDVLHGRYFVSRLIADRYLQHPLSADANPARLFSVLTARQREVLQLVAEGKSAKEIAALLFISVKTVEFHKKHLLEELHLRSSAELIRYAVEQAWVAS